MMSIGCRGRMCGRMIRDRRERLFAQSRDHGGKHLDGRVAECPGTWRLLWAIFAVKERHEGVRAQGEFTRGIVGHSIVHAVMIANRRGDGGVAVNDGADAKEVGDDGVDGGSLFKGPRDSGGVVTSGDGGVPGPLWAN